MDTEIFIILIKNAGIFKFFDENLEYEEKIKKI